jgi:hypothetical protein
VRNAAAQFEVSKSTLHDKVSGRVHVNATPGKQLTVPPHKESLFADIRLQRWGMVRATESESSKTNLKTKHKKPV